MTMIDEIKEHGAAFDVAVDDDDNLIDIEVIQEMINSIKGCIWRLTRQADQYHIIAGLEDVDDEMNLTAHYKEQAKKILCGILDEKIEQLEQIIADWDKDEN